MASFIVEIIGTIENRLNWRKQSNEDKSYDYNGILVHVWKKCKSDKKYVCNNTTKEGKISTNFVDGNMVLVWDYKFNKLDFG